MHCLTVAYEGATPVWHRRGGGDPLPPFTTYSVNTKQCLTGLTVTSSVEPSATSISDGIFVVVVVVRKRLDTVECTLSVSV